jgi:hypothetical protein
MKNALSEFVDKLMQETVDVTNLDENTSATMKNDILERLLKSLNLAILEHLTPEQINEFESILSEGDDTKQYDYLITAIPNFEQVLAQEMLNFKQLYLNS